LPEEGDFGGVEVVGSVDKVADLAFQRGGFGDQNAPPGVRRGVFRIAMGVAKICV
jgi:hypothetical protein